MKPIARLTFAGMLCLIASCERKYEPHADSHFAPEPVLTESIWANSAFTPWMSRAELQHLQETNPSDQYFAHVEGRYLEGNIQYRAVVKPFSADQYDQWAVFWGINEAELFDWELRLLKAGFARKDAQVFEDSTGKALHQIVWLKSKGSDALTSTEEIAENPEPIVEIPPSLPVSGNATGMAPEPDLPTKSAPAEAEITTKAPVAKPVPEADLEKPVAKKSIYVVQPGDTLGKIAKRRGVSVGDLKSVNGLKSDILRIGQKLKIAKEGN
jgi:LysM repeat protein